MAKVKMNGAKAMPRRERFPYQAEKRVRKRIEKSRIDADPFALVHNADFISPKSCAYTTAGKEDNGVLKPRFIIEGRENLFQPEPTVVESYQLVQEASKEAREMGQDKPRVATPVRLASHTEHFENVPASKMQPRNLKRARTKPRVTLQHQRIGDSDGDDESTEPAAKRISSNTFYINDIEALKRFYTARFRELTMKPLRQIGTEWVKALAPDRLNKYGKYHNEPPSNMPEGSQPPWWPLEVPYKEPSHLQLQHLIPLAVDIMLVHRRIDEESGKRKGSWIAMLKRKAMYHTEETPTESFSSSRDQNFNELMKERATKVILPTLFEVAQDHEDFVTMHGLFEGSGKADCGLGKNVTWTHTPRPDRATSNKRQRRVKAHVFAARDELTPDVSGDETEVDDHMSIPSTSFGSFQSRGSHGEGETKLDLQTSPPSPHSPPRASTPTSLSQCPVVPEPEMQDPSSVALPYSPFDQSMDRLHLADALDLDSKPVNDFGTPHFMTAPPSFATLRYPAWDATNSSTPDPTPFPIECSSNNSFYVPQSHFVQPISSGMLPSHVTRPYIFNQPTQQFYGNLEMHGLPGYPYEPDQGFMNSITPGHHLIISEHLRNGLPRVEHR